MRRSNLLFFGIEDDAKEDWTATENKITDFCSEKLDIVAGSIQFDRAHRLGKFSDTKRRPVITKLTYYKDKERILANARKLKGSDFYIREDFSLSTRQARQKLIEHAKTLKKPFKLSVDRLRIGGKTYAYDVTSASVLELNR
ncbi:hypothetical protein HPB50_012321 [Hyalomma asiaticum]|uniref:Uncharacterized protein n=1 Tax=Hyalomma asiaticum TaxID=266040 RepID=A0ACB7SEY9_HYAAI|nr:hypothetical protein HPB50_012321 [Hyalomma asiaticum]